MAKFIKGGNCKLQLSQVKLKLCELSPSSKKRESSINLFSLLGLPTFIAALTTSGLQAGVVVQYRSSNQGLYHDKGHNKNFLNTLPKAG